MLDLSEGHFSSTCESEEITQAHIYDQVDFTTAKHIYDLPVKHSLWTMWICVACMYMEYAYTNILYKQLPITYNLQLVYSFLISIFAKLLYISYI